MPIYTFLLLLNLPVRMHETCLRLGYCYCLTLNMIFLLFHFSNVVILLCLVPVCQPELKSLVIDDRSG